MPIWILCGYVARGANSGNDDVSNSRGPGREVSTAVGPPSVARVPFRHQYMVE